MRFQVTLADSNPLRRDRILKRIADWNMAGKSVENESELWDELSSDAVTVVLLGLDDSATVLEKLIAQGHQWVILLLDEGANVQVAARGIKQGASDAFSDPIDYVCLHRSIVELFERAKSSKTSQETKNANTPKNDTQGESPMIGRSVAFEAVRESIREVAPTSATVLILGESGTGKELVARDIHNQSDRASGPYLPVNMAALPITLAEGALFGHRQGAFTGADRDQVGWCEYANGGTLFLDEICELDLALQAKLLRFLETRTFQRIGESDTRRVDVRIIAATNRDPEEMIKEGMLRADLYFRLNVYPLHLPKLSERRDDIEELAAFFLQRAGEQYNKQLLGFTPAANEALAAFDWPGNIRQLENMIHRIAIGAQTDRIDRHHLPSEIVGFVQETSPSTGLRKMEQIERNAIIDALRSCDGNAVAASKILGLGQATVYRKMRRYGIPLKQQRRRSELEAKQFN